MKLIEGTRTRFHCYEEPDLFPKHASSRRTSASIPDVPAPGDYSTDIDRGAPDPLDFLKFDVAILPENATTTTVLFSDTFRAIAPTKVAAIGSGAAGSTLLPMPVTDAWSKLSINDQQGWRSVTRMLADVLVSISGQGEASPAAARPSAPVAPDAYAATADRPSAFLEKCLADLGSWLGIGLAAAAEAVGISRGTIYAWRTRGSDPRPGTITSVLRIHGLVASAVAAVGVDRAREWFHAGIETPLEQLLNAQGDAVAIREISRRVRAELTRGPLPTSNPWMSIGVDEILAEELPTTE